METYTWTTGTREGDHGDSSSTEEVESPRSVVTAARRVSGRWRKWWKKTGDHRIKEKGKGYLMHSQVVRIKEEELQISEDLIGDHCSCCYSFVSDYHSLDDDSAWCKTVVGLPASPLGSKRG